MDFGETGVRGNREGFELILVTILTRLTTDVISIKRRGAGAVGPCDAPDDSDHRAGKNHQLDQPDQFQRDAPHVDDVARRDGKTLSICTGNKIGI